MASASLTVLRSRLPEIDEVLSARDAICPMGAGRPSQRRGAAVVRAGTVLLAALFEGYVEDVYDAAVDILYASQSSVDRESLKKATSGNLNNAGPYKVTMLFFHIGIPWIMASQKLHWKKFPNASVVAMLQALMKARNKIAHGSTHTVRKTSLGSWRNQIERLAERLDEVIADHLQSQTGTRPW